LASFDRAIELKPDYAAAYYNKSICYLFQDNIDAALAALQAAIERNPNYQEDAPFDPDFSTIARDPRFRQVIEGKPLTKVDTEAQDFPTDQERVVSEEPAMEPLELETLELETLERETLPVIDVEVVEEI
jgi:tetratricopeptide (TPR) repeat protein